MHRRVAVIALDPEIFSMNATTCISYRGIGVISQVSKMSVETRMFKAYSHDYYYDTFFRKQRYLKTLIFKNY